MDLYKIEKMAELASIGDRLDISYTAVHDRKEAGIPADFFFIIEDYAMAVAINPEGAGFPYRIMPDDEPVDVGQLATHLKKMRELAKTV